MYRIEDIKQCLNGLVGFRQNVNPELPDYRADNIASESGLYVQDAHKLINDENIDYAIPNFTAIDAINAQTLRDDYMRNLLDEAINNVVYQTIHSDKIARTINEKFTLWDGTPNYGSVRAKIGGKFVGFKLCTKQMQGLAAQINKIGYLGTADNPHINIYVYHTSDLVDPIATIHINNTTARKFVWHEVDRQLNYLGLNETGGEYIIGYKTDEVVGSSYNVNYSFSKQPCRKCVGESRYSNWHLRNKYLDVEPVEYDLLQDGTIDLESERYTLNTTFGLNIDFSAICDVTEIICSQREVFAKGIQQQTAIELLKVFAYSTRDNSLSLETKQMALNILNGMSEAELQGILELQKHTIESLSLDFSGLDSACLPCKAKIRTGRA